MPFSLCESEAGATAASNRTALDMNKLEWWPKRMKLGCHFGLKTVILLQPLLSVHYKDPRKSENPASVEVHI